MHEKLLSRSIGRAEVLKLSPAHFEQAKADYIVARGERLEVQPTSMHSARRKACTQCALPCSRALMPAMLRLVVKGSQHAD